MGVLEAFRLGGSKRMWSVGRDTNPFSSLKGKGNTILFNFENPKGDLAKKIQELELGSSQTNLIFESLNGLFESCISGCGEHLNLIDAWKLLRSVVMDDDKSSDWLSNVSIKLVATKHDRIRNEIFSNNDRLKALVAGDVKTKKEMFSAVKLGKMEDISKINKIPGMVRSIVQAIVDDLPKTRQFKAERLQLEKAGEEDLDGVPKEKYRLHEKALNGFDSIKDYCSEHSLTDALKKREWVNSGAFADGIKYLVKTTRDVSGGIGDSVAEAVSGIFAKDQDLINPDGGAAKPRSVDEQNKTGHGRNPSNVSVTSSIGDSVHLSDYEEQNPQPNQMVEEKNPSPQPSFMGRVGGFGRKMFGSCFGCCSPQPEACQTRQ